VLHFVHLEMSWNGSVISMRAVLKSHGTPLTLNWAQLDHLSHL